MFLNVMYIAGFEIYNEDILKVLIAAFLGAIIGFEREWKGKPAGLRTLALVSAGSAVFTLVSYHMADTGGLGSDATRIASNIVTGVGFIGAGIIFRGNNHVQGLTTAATIWVAAAIGMGVGAGYYPLAVATTAIVWIVLVLLYRLELVLLRFTQTLTYKVCFHEAHRATDIKYYDYFEDKGYKLDLTKYVKEDGAVTVFWTVSASKKKHEVAVARLLNDDKVTDLTYN